MVIDNKKTTISLQLRKLLLIVLLAIVVVLLLYFDIFGEHFKKFDQKYLIIGLIVLYLIYYFLGIFRSYHYFYYSDLSPSKLVFRFYSLAPLSKRQNSIEIRKDEFHKFALEKKMLGLREYLVLYQKTPRGIAKYKPISISLLKKSEKNDLKVALTYFQQEK
ncbi:MAG TPA: hypothetical protein VIH57_25555 [Bacteroidales bacterium]|jgi:hypothetical protein